MQLIYKSLAILFKVVISLALKSRQIDNDDLNTLFSLYNEIESEIEEE
jgi:hypothetical protein